MINIARRLHNTTFRDYVGTVRSWVDYPHERKVCYTQLHDRLVAYPHNGKLYMAVVYGVASYASAD